MIWFQPAKLHIFIQNVHKKQDISSFNAKFILFLPRIATFFVSLQRKL